MRKILLLCMASVVLFSCAGLADAADVVKGESIVRVGEDIHVPVGVTAKSVVAIRGNIYVRGSVEEDVVAVVGDIRLYPTASVGEDAVTIGGSIIKDEGARIGGDLIDISVGRRMRGMLRNVLPYAGALPVAGFVIFRLMLLAGFLGLAALIISFVAKYIGVIGARIEKNWWKALLWGLLGSILIAPVIVFLAISVIGIPLILVVVILVSAAMVMGYVAVAQIIGRKLVKAAKKKKLTAMMEVLLGIAVLFMIDLIPLIGALVRAAVLLIGFGGALTTKLGFEKARK